MLFVVSLPPHSWGWSVPESKIPLALESVKCVAHSNLTRRVENYGWDSTVVERKQHLIRLIAFRWLAQNQWVISILPRFLESVTSTFPGEITIKDMLVFPSFWISNVWLANCLEIFAKLLRLMMSIWQILRGSTFKWSPFKNFQFDTFTKWNIYLLNVLNELDANVLKHLAWSLKKIQLLLSLFIHSSFMPISSCCSRLFQIIAWSSILGSAWGNDE